MRSARVAESGSFPKLAAVALAIAYAAAWLVGRPAFPRGWFASTTYAGTSALILAPMLWEITLRFKVLSPSTAAGVLAAFVSGRLCAGVEAQSHLHRLGCRLTGAVTAIALLIATHDMVPFVCSPAADGPPQRDCA
jgi:hypothetical protein